MASEPAPESARAAGQALLSLVRSLIAFGGRKGVFTAIYIALGAIFESVGLIMLIPLLGLVIGNRASPGEVQRLSARVFDAVSVTSPFGRLALLMAGFAILMVIRGVVVSLRDTSVLALQVEYIEHLRGQIATSLAAAGWNQVQTLRHAKIMSILSGDIQRISMAANYLLQASAAAVILVTQVILSFVLAPGLALLSFALLVAGGLAMVPVVRRARALGRYVSGANVSLIDTVAQFLGGLKLALSQDLQGAFISEFRDTLRGLTSRQITYYRQQTASRVALQTLSALVGIVVILVGYGTLGLSAPVLIAFLLVVMRMSSPAMQIQQGFQQLAHGLPAFEAVVDLIAELRPLSAPYASAARAVPEGAIVLDGVSYRHPNGDGTDSHGVGCASLCIRQGSFVGIAGTSGAGKTTLADLLVGLLTPQAGRILVGGVPLDDAMLAGWRAQLSYISQDPFLFHDTIRRNLRWAKPDASEAAMWDALAIAGADDIVRRMEGGLDTIVGERGTLVSGGERQRLALARGLMRQPRLLVMDEATNAIDVLGERALLERLLAIRPRLTIVMIAHRVESIALCDHVLRMENGELRDDPSVARRDQSVE